MFDAALLAPLAVALVAEGEKTSRMLLQHGEEVEPWRRNERMYTTLLLENHTLETYN